MGSRWLVSSYPKLGLVGLSAKHKALLSVLWCIPKARHLVETGGQKFQVIIWAQPMLQDTLSQKLKEKPGLGVTLM